MAKCSLGCGDDVMYARTAASGGKSSITIDARPVTNGTCWFEKTDGKNFLVVASKEHPRPEFGAFFRLHNPHCPRYKAKKEVEAALKRAAKKS